MNIIRGVVGELLGLFVDDGSLVFAVIAWVIGGVICLRHQLVDPRSGAVLLFLGIALLLAENIARSTRNRVTANLNA
jgi:hypothetical protein